MSIPQCIISEFPDTLNDGIFDLDLHCGNVVNTLFYSYTTARKWKYLGQSWLWGHGYPCSKMTLAVFFLGILHRELVNFLFFMEIRL